MQWRSAVAILLYLNCLQCSSTPGRPHIIFILADDLGFNDVGFRGSNQIPTPNIDALAYGGVILNQYYVTAICTPSRSALMTGRHPIHNGMQHTVLYAAEPRGLPLTEKLLPQYLKELGYTTRIVGKWHLGFHKKEYTPTYRGFDSHLGFWSGHHDYFDHTAVETPYWGLDMRRGLKPAWELHGQYSTDVFTREAVKIIRSHNSTQSPLYLYLAHAAVHSSNPYNPLPVPDEEIIKFNSIADYNRRRFAGILSKLDESVGKVVEALSETGMLSNSVIVFSTDNGGPAAGFNSNAASNWPLRGVKNTLWEGGVRGVGLIWSPLLVRPNRLANQMFHISDWLPTLYHVAGGDPTTLEGLDGLDAWEALSNDQDSNRTEVLHNIDDIYGNAALTVGQWKLIKGTSYNGEWDGWYGPSGRDDSQPYDVGQVLGSKAGRALAKLKMGLTPEQVWSQRSEAQVTCFTSSTIPTVTTEELVAPVECKPLEAPCLFNVLADPCEQYNLADRYPGILRHMLQLLDGYNATAVPPSNLPMDPRADPRLWDHTWNNFADYSVLTNAVS